MRRATGAGLSLVLLVGATAATASSSATPKGYSVVSRSELGPGVEYTTLGQAKPAVVAHVAHVLPGAPVDLRVFAAHDKLSTGPGDLETPSSICGRQHCVVGVNGDFHDNGVPVGGMVSGGRMVQSPDPGRPQLSITTSGQLTAGIFPWSGALTLADGTAVPIDAVNTAPPPGGLALFTPDYGGATPPSGRAELVVGTHGAVAALNRTTNLDLRGLRTGAGSIPGDGAVLSGDGAAASQLSAAWSRKQSGGPAAARARMVINSPVAAAASLGAYPIVLHDGKKATPYGTDPNLIRPLQPHTLVAWNPAGDVYLVAVDGRQLSSVGLTMDQAADFLLGLGATEAVNLDGGGGTTMVQGDTVVNRPSDPDPAHPGGYFQRGATNVLAVIARPAPAPTTAPGSIKPLSLPAGGSSTPTTGRARPNVPTALDGVTSFAEPVADALSGPDGGLSGDGPATSPVDPP
ncbi:MAG TPA: phosphodiester glycosidase family protein, partial [Acidimicrobiia bacterium]|nr:phosphodiester glycosidase family protein [Acidimicrobiia bacterium]